MDILETKQRPQLKRTRTSPDAMQNFQSQSEVGSDQNKEVAKLFDDMTPANNDLVNASMVTDQRPVPLIANGRRKRPGAKIGTGTSSSPMLSPARGHSFRKRPYVQSMASSDVSMTLPTTDTSEVKRLVDGAMRLSVCCSLQKTSNDLKIKANTFNVGLADVAPVLWKPGYLLVGKVFKMMRLS